MAPLATSPQEASDKVSFGADVTVDAWPCLMKKSMNWEDAKEGVQICEAQKTSFPGCLQKDPL